MRRDAMRKLRAAGYILGLMSLCLAATESYGATPSVCASGVAEPPFLSYGVDPNVLLMIDNSASMYDLAYVETAGYCKDESYAPLSPYQGYFTSDTWYKYDFTDGRFEPQPDNSACAGVEHSTSDVCLTLNTAAPSNSIFLAKGNFLNWVAISKFDIQKSILTGGKNEPIAGGYNMILESRGCSASRFVKEVQFTDNMFLTIGVRAAKDAEKANTDDNTTRIDIFEVTATGFQDDQCKVAIANLQDLTGQGNVSQPLKDCMGYDQNSPAYLADSNAAFNAAIHNCWYLAKQGTFPISVQNDINACENVYEGGALPASITPDDTAYVCSGVYNASTYPDGEGYVGRCWKPEVLPAGCLIVPGIDPDRDSVAGVDPDGTTDDIPLQAVAKPYRDPFRGTDGYIYDCDGNFNDNTGNCAGGTWEVRTYETIAGACNSAAITGADWAGTAAQKESCVLDALQDYCGYLELPEVVDPTDLASGSSSDFWNLPAVLVDSGVVAQLNQPVVTLRGHVLQTKKPSGLLQDYADQIRIGAMKFNTNGSKTEALAGSYIEPVDPNQDGSQLLENIDKSAAHTDNLVSAINLVKADSWTPLAEAMLNAIGYYSQISAGRRCNVDDFTVGTDPVQYYCQDNHVVIITDGASSADLYADVKTMATPDPTTSIDGDVETGECKSTDLFDNTITLLGSSTYFDDLTYFGKKSSPKILYGDANDQIDGEDKNTITTHIVVSGTLRDTGTTDECNPKVLMTNAAANGGNDGASLIEAPTPELVRSKLEQTFAGIRAGASAGSAASVISSSRGGEGAIYQAIFWPTKPSTTDATVTIRWAGEVHALFIDTIGSMYEDTDGDRKLTTTGANADKRVIIYFDNAALTSKGCYTTPINGTCSNPIDLDDVHFLWSANDWLAKISNTGFLPYGANDQYQNRLVGDYLSNKRQRYIFTWNDLDNDGIVDTGEVLPFVSKDSGGVATDWAAMPKAANRRPATNDFNVNAANPDNAADNAEVNRIVDWIRGVEFPDKDVDGKYIYRSRKVNKKMKDSNGNFPNTEVIWRLGDVIHSTPTAVARPMEGLHLLYGDTTYANFIARWANRRQMIYFGANDGMLHAVNGGFYNETNKQFCLANTDCTDEAGKPELGAEMWAYVPYNLLPHLKCLTSPDYALANNHKYYVDQRPRVFDARIFSKEVACDTNPKASTCIHPDGWGTVLVGSMRFGGSRIEADRLSGDTTPGTDNRNFTSSYFVLDITNPEAPPVLLGEYTMLEDGSVDLGFTTSSPTPAVMKSTAATATIGDWYLLMGSGPRVEKPSDGIGTLPIFDDINAIKGYSDQKPKVAVFPLEWLTTDKKPFRIPDTPPSAANRSGVFTMADSSNGFISDMITVDYDLDANYMSDAVYFGTVEHGSATVSQAEAGTAEYRDVWDGRLYRIVMRELVAGDQIATTPDDWDTSLLFNAGQPITAAPSVGTDLYNYWIYFGTGRFLNAIDKPDDAQQSFYGVKELTDCQGEFTWPTTITKAGLADVSQILVDKGDTASSAKLYCLAIRGNLSSGDINNVGCLPTTDVKYLDQLITHIAGTGSTFGSSCVDSNSDGTVDALTGKSGWYRDFPAVTWPRERNVGQATLLGGLLNFSTYQPYDDLCKQDGVGNLYGLYYQTGTAWFETVFGARGLEGTRVLESISLGRGLATTPNLHVGSGEDATAFVQTSTGEIIEIPLKPPIPNFKSGRQSWQER